MKDRKRQLFTGNFCFGLSGICAISSGVMVNLLQQMHGFSYSVTGTLLSCMNIGNLAASFAAGILPSKIGTRNTVAILCSGYFLGYLLMAGTGSVGLLMAAFLMVGLAKGCTINNCTVLVGNNSPDRAKGMTLMHAFYACGALICPFLITASAALGTAASMLTISLAGLALWSLFMSAKLPGKPTGESKKESADFSFLRSGKFWLLTGLLFCQNAAETSVTGWLVTYYKDQQILSGLFSAYTVTIMWAATLIGRLLIAFVFKIKNTFKAVCLMGFGCTVLYALMVHTQQPLLAVILLFAFAFSIAGVNPMAVAGTGKAMTAASMGVMLPMASLGAIIMPWIIGQVADLAGLQTGMFCNLIPCVGMMILSAVIFLKKLA